MDQTWGSFKLRVNIRVSLADAYKAWATPAGLECWFLRKANFTTPEGQAARQRAAGELVQAGDLYEWFWHGYSDSVSVKGKVLTANGKDHFAFSFSLGVPVSIHFYREQEETIVELRETDLPTDEETALKHYVGDSKGWIFYLTNLKSVLEGGLDLRNRNVALCEVITA